MPIQYRGTTGEKASLVGGESTAKTTHWCFCCWLAILLGATLLVGLFLYFLEGLLSGLWSLATPQFGAQPMAVTVPEDSKFVDICVRDFGCEDGDRVRLELNENVVFEGELLREAACVRQIPVLEGANQVSLTALNGTGGRGSCPNNVNTGAVTIIANQQQTEMWEQAPGDTAVTTVQVSLELNEGGV